tara:strand:+ start:554 stop:817 length:264 start_codon:yes stop_codon:yes gene_type:complete
MMPPKRLDNTLKQLAYLFGEVFTNPYLGCKFTEVLSTSEKRIGWVWTHRDGRVVIAPHLGSYIWYNEKGEEWTVDTGAQWLALHSHW